jgi:hypothetical protein
MDKNISDKLNNYIDTMTKTGKAICNTECQNDMEKKALYNKYLKALNVLKHAPDNFKTAENNYFIKTGQKKSYDNLRESRAINDITDYMKEVETNFNKKIKRISTLKAYLDSQNYFKNNIVDSYETYKYRLNNYKHKIDETTKKANIDNRMANFYNDKSQTLAYWSNGILYYVYLILVVVSILLFVIKKNYKNIKMYPFLLLVVILPFFIHDIYEIILNMTRHVKMNNTYFVFTLFSLFLILTLYLTANLPKKKLNIN